MPNRFSIGDKVIIKRGNDRTPKELLRELRLDHHRTITAIFYDPKTQHTRYYLGTNKRGVVDLHNRSFRACELRLWRRGRIGHPRTKRLYKRHWGKAQGIIDIDYAPQIEVINNAKVLQL